VSSDPSLSNPKKYDTRLSVDKRACKPALIKHVLPRFRRPQTPISAVGSDKSASPAKIELNPNPGVSALGTV